MGLAIWPAMVYVPLADRILGDTLNLSSDTTCKFTVDPLLISENVGLVYIVCPVSVLFDKFDPDDVVTVAVVAWVNPWDSE